MLGLNNVIIKKCRIVGQRESDFLYLNTII